ncbi:MAG: hypothetical protein IIC87_06895 [Chloroflexi bacterium]|nr:hypothetical protein [Chloroflexota bacterium]
MKRSDEHLRGHIRRRQYLGRAIDAGKNVDQVARVQMLRILMWTIPFGGAAGLLAGSKLGHPVIGLIVGAALATSVSVAIVESGAKMGSQIYNPSGSSTPHKRDYSMAASLAIRGQYAKAAAAYELAISEYPEDPEPYLCLARLLRDDMGRHEEAARWFKRARTDTHISAGQALLASRELIELYTVQLGEPAKAAPELARLAEKYKGTPEGDWARDELAEVKRGMAEAEEA